MGFGALSPSGGLLYKTICNMQFAFQGTALWNSANFKDVLDPHIVCAGMSTRRQALKSTAACTTCCCMGSTHAAASMEWQAAWEPDSSGGSSHGLSEDWKEMAEAKASV